MRLTAKVGHHAVIRGQLLVELCCSLQHVAGHALVLGHLQR
jgi:hypothetical protein